LGWSILGVGKDLKSQVFLNFRKHLMSVYKETISKSNRGRAELWDDFSEVFPSEKHLVSAAIALGAEGVRQWSPLEIDLAAKASLIETSKPIVSALKELIKNGGDPLGDAFCYLRSSERRREKGATYTPHGIVEAMAKWASEIPQPERVVDPGTGSARFLMRVGDAFPQAQLVGIDVDPLAAILARANLAVKGYAGRSRIILCDYRKFVEQVEGKTLYIGNPPYVRHHQINAKWKNWLHREASKLGLAASKLAGLHVHFFLSTVRHAKVGDVGVFITAAEWLDVNYGSLIRSLVLSGLGGKGITVIDPKAQPFPDAATTAAITTFEIGSKPSSVYFRRIEDLDKLGCLNKGREICRERLAAEPRWSHLLYSTEKPPTGYVELGEIYRVHRGQVTGNNHVWIAGEHSKNLTAGSVLFRTITKAREVLDAEGVLDDLSKLRFVIDIPSDLDVLDAADRKSVAQFLKVAKSMGANKGYVAQNRKAWWSVGLRTPAPIISTYMARRPPAFVVNKADARHINIAHGLYPRQLMSQQAQENLVRYLQTNVSRHLGRTYAGGLTKFEPREMERLIVPNPEMLETEIFQ
jgi:adenine-specific DNA-methyltransferase